MTTTLAATTLGALVAVALTAGSAPAHGQTLCPDITDPTFKVLRKAVLANGATLPPGITCLVAGRRHIVKDGKKRRVTAVIGVYEYDGRPIRFETLRMSRTPSEVRRADPGAPRYEVDVRFLTDEADSIIDQTGGHEHIDETWDDPEEDARDGRAFTAPRATSPIADYARVAATLDTLATHPFRRTFASEYQALMQNREYALAGMEPFAPPDGDVVTEDLEPEAETAPRAGVYRHAISVFSDRLHPIYPAARHGATIAYRIHPNGFAEAYRPRCNHGRCPAQMFSPYVTKCTFVSRANRRWHVHTRKCYTNYSPFSFSGTHNCNDDAATEYRSVRYDYHPDGIGGVCSDPYRHDYTDGCY